MIRLITRFMAVLAILAGMMVLVVAYLHDEILLIIGGIFIIYQGLKLLKFTFK